jgi:hypothetical protein
MEASIHVEGDDVVKFPRRCLHAGLADWPRPAGDIYENVDAAAKGRLGHLNGRIALSGIGQVAGDHDGLAAKGFRLVGDRRNRRGVASQQRQFAALGSESMRDGSAHPFGRACNHHDSILK